MPPPRSYKGPFIILAGVLFVVIVCGVTFWIVKANSDDLPYSAEKMEDAQLECSVAAGMQGIDEMQCLRDELPKLSDDQLRRLNSLIDEAE